MIAYYCPLNRTYYFSFCHLPFISLLGLLGLATSCSATFHQLLRFSAIFWFFLAFLEYFFTFSATFISFRKKCARSGRLGVVCLSMRSALSRGTSFKMADNTVSDSDSRWKECADEGPINRIAEGWGQISLPPKKLK